MNDLPTIAAIEYVGLCENGCGLLIQARSQEGHRVCVIVSPGERLRVSVLADPVHAEGRETLH